MRPFINLVICLTVVNLGIGQVTVVDQPSRFELDIKYADSEPLIFPLESEGLLVVEDSKEFDGRRRIRKFIQLDTLLNIIWATLAAIPEEEELSGYEYLNGSFQLLYTHQQHEYLKGSIVNINLKEKQIIADPFNTQLAMKLTHFTSAGKNSIIGGQVGTQPMLALFDSDTKRIRILPQFFLSDTELIDVRANRNGTFNCLHLQKKGREKTMFYKAFDQSGNLLIEDQFLLDPEMTIQSAMSSTLLHNEVMVAGIYSYGNSRLSSGLFTVILNPSEEKKVSYTDFPRLIRFLDYMSVKRADKIMKKAETRRKTGLSPDFRIAATLHRVDENENGFLLFGETFQVPSSSQNTLMNMPPYFNRPGLNSIPYQYSNMPWRYGYDQFTTQARQISEVRMISAFAVAFDKKGNYQFDKSIDLNEISVPPDIQFADYVTFDGEVDFFFPTENGIGFSINNNGDLKKTINHNEIKLGVGQSLVYETNLEHTIRRWYDKHLFIYGTRIIRDYQYPGEDQKRRVFFVNKVSPKFNKR